MIKIENQHYHQVKQINMTGEEILLFDQSTVISKLELHIQQLEKH